MANESEPHNLEYAKRPNRLVGRRPRILLIVILGISGVGLAAYHFRHWIAHFAYLRSQHACMVYSRPQGQVVFEEDPVRARALVSSNRGYTFAPRNLFNDVNNRPPPGWGPPAVYLPQEVNALGIGIPGFDAIVFMHERQAVGCKSPRLIVVWVGRSATNPDGSHNAGFLDVTYAPASGDLLSRIVMADASHSPLIGVTRMRVTAGQPDPLNKARFTFAYNADGRSVVVDGQLLPSDEVAFWPRGGKW